MERSFMRANDDAPRHRVVHTSRMRNPKNYSVYLKAHALAVQIENAFQQRKSRGGSGVSTQLRTASASVPANIAEGCGHSSQREFARFLQHAIASCVEVENHLMPASDTRAVNRTVADGWRRANAEVQRMLASLLKKVRDGLTDDDDNDSVAAMQRRRGPRVPVSDSMSLPTKTNASRTEGATRVRSND